MTTLAFKLYDQPAVFGSNRPKASLWERAKRVSQSLTRKDVLINAGIGAGIGIAAKVLTASVLAGSGALTIALAGAAVTSVARESYSQFQAHTKEAGYETLDFQSKAQLALTSVFNRQVLKKAVIGTAISGVSFGVVTGGAELLHNEHVQNVVKGIGAKLGSSFNIQTPSFLKGWFAKPVGPSVHGVIIRHEPFIPVVAADVRAPVESIKPAVFSQSSYPVHQAHDVVGAVSSPEHVVDSLVEENRPEVVVTDKRVDMLREVAQAADQDTSMELSNLEALKNLQPDHVAKICDVDMPKTFGAVNDIKIDCETYKADMDAGDVTIIKNINEPEPKKGLRVLFASAKEKTTSFFARAAIGDSGVIPEMTEQAMKDASPVADSVGASVGTSVTPELDSDVDVTPIAESGLAEQVEEVLAEPVAEASAEPELTPQQMAQRIMQGVSYQYGN